jgi:hypothetical protein
MRDKAGPQDRPKAIAKPAIARPVTAPVLNIISLAFLLCLTLGCQDQALKVELQAIKDQAKVEEQNKELIRHYPEEFDKVKFAIMDELCAEDIIVHHS